MATKIRNEPRTDIEPALEIRAGEIVGASVSKITTPNVGVGPRKLTELNSSIVMVIAAIMAGGFAGISMDTLLDGFPGNVRIYMYEVQTMENIWHLQLAEKSRMKLEGSWNGDARSSKTSVHTALIFRPAYVNTTTSEWTLLVLFSAVEYRAEAHDDNF
ncbi:uncharacterized protein LOC122530680 [Frieseomelitta varia]|uniref:uncharacterized protein LOC122530680 n=1 Tax=Frieseomelitta varia TaxID=561572 RepID=UPI001CB6918D|nr:uncharacterized protein LOC122530680 [Frieseomelitta varia]